MIQCDSGVDWLELSETLIPMQDLWYLRLETVWSEEAQRHSEHGGAGCHPSTREEHELEAILGYSGSWGQPGLCSKTLYQERKKKRGVGGREEKEEEKKKEDKKKRGEKEEGEDTGREGREEKESFQK